GVRELPRGAYVPTAAARGDAGRTRNGDAGRRAPRRAPRVFRRLRADGDLRAHAPAARRAVDRPGHRRAERHDHGHPARRRRARGRRRQPSPAPTLMAIDPILLEVLRNRLDAIADEMELTLLKSAASPIVKEGLDASAALFNTRGETIAQAAAIPIHLGALQFAAQRLVRAFPPHRMRDG